MLQAKFFRRLGDEQDKKAFWIAFLGGFALISVIRGIGFITSSSNDVGLSFFDFLAISTAIVVILLYTAYFMVTTNRSGISLDRASDNVYYVGLLFTLSSLAISLIKLVNVDPNSGGTAAKVIDLLPDFGLALFSTIFGIAGRISLQQMRNDPEDIETEAREQLGAAITQLKFSIGEIVDSLEDLATQMRITLVDLNTNVKQTIEKTSEENTNLIKTAAADVSALSERLQSQVAVVESFTQEATTSFSGILSTIRTEFEGFSDIPENLRNSFGALSAELTTAIAKVQEASGNQSQLSLEMLNSVRTLQIAFSDNGIAKISEFIEQAEQKISDINSSLDSSGRQVENTTQSLGHTVEEISASSDEVAAISNRLQASVASVDEANSEYLDELSRAAETLRDRTDEV